MKITLSRKQYKSLLKIIYLGDWLVNSYRTKDLDKEMQDIEQHILSYAEQFNCKDITQKAEKNNEIFPTREFEDMLHPYIEEYDNETFWDELIERLAKKDILDQYDTKTIEEMEGIDRLMLIGKFRKKYEIDFSENGLDNIKLDINNSIDK